jgi:adenine-specific DNA-methyltransferase
MPILNWLGRDDALKTATNTPYRLLEEVPELGYGDKTKENMVIQGDNLEALKALLPFYAGQMKCIYIDPPYNTGSAFEHYDDNLEHSTWLSMIMPRLELLKEFLREDGYIFIQIDDEEQAYLKVLCDEVFGRNNFINMISVNMKNIAGASGGGEDKRLKKNCEFILCYAKNYAFTTPLSAVYDYTEMYNVVQSYKENGKNWHYTSVLVSSGEKSYIGSTVDGEGNEIKIYRRIGAKVKSVNQLMQQHNLTEKEVYYKYGNMIFEAKDAQSSIRTRVIDFKNKNGVTDDIISIEYIPKTGRNKGVLYEQFYKGDKCRLFAWLKDISEVINGVLYKKERQGTLWDYTQTINNLTKEGNVLFPNGKKPELLISRILEMSTNENDLVLDSFLGSGTTAAVAHKMGRRYIGIEMGNHAITHCVPRLKAVIDGEQGGISKSVNWQGGGGFRFFKLGDEVFDADGCINKNISFENLSAHIWFTETKTPFNKPAEKTTYLGTCDNVSYALLYNGILRDKRVDGGNVLTNKTLNVILDDMKHQSYEKLVIYGESSRISPARLKTLHIEFKQTPYDIKAR